MEWLEANPLPNICANCTQEDCYNCEHAGKRWNLSKREELLTRRKILAMAIERLQRQIKAIDEELEEISAKLF